MPTRAGMTVAGLKRYDDYSLQPASSCHFHTRFLDSFARNARPSRAATCHLPYAMLKPRAEGSTRAADARMCARRRCLRSISLAADIIEGA